MVFQANYEGSPEIGAYSLLTNTYALIGKSTNRIFYSYLQSSLTIPICETFINQITTVGSFTVGNKHGLLLPHNTTDVELQHIRNSLSNTVKVKRVNETFNALGNVILVNDHVALVHADLGSETVEILKDYLKVDVLVMAIGNESLVGTFGRMNNVGLLVQPNVDENEVLELSNMLSLRVIAGTVNRGNNTIGGGVVVNDYVGFVGHRSTVHEMTVMNAVFGLKNEDEDEMKKALIDSCVVQ